MNHKPTPWWQFKITAIGISIFLCSALSGIYAQSSGHSPKITHKAYAAPKNAPLNMDRHIEVSTDPAGNISVSDAFNHNIKSIEVVILAKDALLKNIQSHSAGQFQVEFKNATSTMSIELYNVFGQMVCSSKLNMDYTKIKMNVIQGIYYYRIVGADNKLVSAGELFLT